MKQLVVFDLDGTLAASKSAMDTEMITLFDSLLALTKVAIISGGDWPQFEKQVLARGLAPKGLANLSLLPTCGTKFYTYRTDWKKLYSEDLTDSEKHSIVTQMNDAVKSLDLIPEKTWGEVIEDRGSQITFSALGQEAPLQKKKKWDPDFSKRKKIQELLEESIPEFSVRLGGTTSVDVTKAGVDKAYGIRKLVEILHIDKTEMLFMGDAIFPGGNDYAVKETGVTSIHVKDPDETKRVVKGIVSYLT
jgi:phosphomannomutase